MVSNQAIIDVSSWDGTLSSSDFRVAALAFAEKWHKFNSALPQWTWVTTPKRPRITSAHQVEGYLSVEKVLLPTRLTEKQEGGSSTGKQVCSCSDNDEFIDDATLVQNYDHQVHHYDFHVAYSPSYRVPVLYFYAYCSDGQTLVLEEIEKDLPANHAKVLLESKWTFITQEEHPYLNRPWYTLHPCGTSEWMKLLFTNDTSVAKVGVAVEQYLVSWFSVVGQVVGLRIPFEMLANCSRV